MKYIKLFENKGSYNNYINNDPILPNVSYVEDEKEVLYNQNITPNIITFTVTDRTGDMVGEIKSYQAEEGMTWKDYINSDYNNNRFVIMGNSVHYYVGSHILFEGGLVNENDLIINNGDYYWSGGGSN